MRVVDYLRLGFAGVKAHKKRALTVVVIVGLLFSVITAGAFALQGLENAALAEMLAPTSGKVLVISNVDTQICGEGCDVAAEVKGIKANIERYGGEMIAASESRTMSGVFYELEGMFGADSGGASEEVSRGVTQVVVPLGMAANLAGIEMPERGASAAEKLKAVSGVREETLGKVVESRAGEGYYIAGILPGGVYASNLSFGNVGQGGNPLDLILGQIQTGVSQSFAVGGVGAISVVGTEEMGMVFARFDDIEAAYDYYRDGANYCLELDRAFGRCGGGYRYQVVAAISDPLGTYENLQNVWLVFKVVAAVLAVIALIIALSTYARLIGKDMKIISLYHAMGATGRQIRAVYVVYLLMLSLMAVAFAVVVGLALAAGLSLVNMTALEQVFVLGFGAAEKSVWLVGWNNLIWGLVGVMLLAAVGAVVLGNGNFRVRELARKMK